jgi:hypothetical protein
MLAKYQWYGDGNTSKWFTIGKAIKTSSIKIKLGSNYYCIILIESAQKLSCHHKDFKRPFSLLKDKFELKR